MPIRLLQANAARIEVLENTSEQPISASASTAPSASATLIPSTPPSRQTSTDSIRNCCRMSLRRAPTAMRTPISRVRSGTDTSMMFITPMPPTTNAMAAMELIISVRMRVVCSIDVRICALLLR
ncbi:hypothetical protein G6F46_014301 [Rhizopus delemar]|nr:hypothetical protein G6F46_014301 [Rhizopus delemar]